MMENRELEVGEQRRERKEAEKDEKGRGMRIVTMNRSTRRKVAERRGPWKVYSGSRASGSRARGASPLLAL